MCDRQFKLCLMILVFQVTLSTESRAQQLSSSGEDKEIHKIKPISHIIPYDFNVKLKPGDLDDYDTYYDMDTKDENDKTRRELLHTTKVLMPGDNYKIFILKHWNKAAPNEVKHKKKLSLIWEDQLKKMLYNKFVPYKQYYDEASGKFTNFYKLQRTGLPKNHVDINLKKAFFNERMNYYDPYSSHNIELHSLRIQPDNRSASDDVIRQVDAGIPIDDNAKDEKKASQSSASLTNYQSNRIYSIDDNKSEVVNKPIGTDKLKSNSVSTDKTKGPNDFDSLYITSGTYTPVSNADVDNTHKLPSAVNSYSFHGNKKESLIPSFPKFDSPKNYNLQLIMPSTSYQNYAPNSFTGLTPPFTSNVEDSNAYNSIYNHHLHPDSYYLRPEEFSTPTRPYNKPYSWLYKDFNNQLPKKYHSYSQKLYHASGYPEKQLFSFAPPAKRPKLLKTKVKDHPYNPVPKGEEYDETSTLYSIDQKFDDQNDAAVNSNADLVADNIPQSSKPDWPYEYYEPGSSSYYSLGHLTIKPTVENAECGDDTEWASNCHRCFCNHGEAVCEKLENCKLRPFGEPMLCKPYSRFRLDDCYTCECNGDGIPECSVQECNHDIATRTQEETNKLDEGLVGERLVKFNYKYPKVSGCPPQKELPTCEQWTVWMSSCHKCRCNENGGRECVRLFGCQMNPKEYGKPARCKPNSTFSPIVPMLCKQCQCDGEGKPYCLLPRNIKS